MKKFISIFVLILILFSIKVNAVTIPKTIDCVTGPSTVCSGTTSTYSLSLGNSPNFQFSRALWTFTQGSFSETQVTTSQSATVTWPTIPNGSSASANVVVSITRVESSNPFSGIDSISLASLPVNIISRPNPPSTPSAVTNNNSGDVYTLTTNSVNANSYSWMVNGGIVQGNGTGRTIQVLSTGCGISGSVFGIANGNQCSDNVSSSPRSFSINIPAPNIAAGSITSFVNPVGPSNVVQYSIQAIPRATSYVWTLSGSGINLLTNPTTSPTTAVRCLAGGSGVLTVTPRNSCGSSVSRSITIDCSNFTGGGGFDFPSTANLIYPNPIQVGQNVSVPVSESMKMIQILNEEGAVLKEVTVNENSEIVTLNTDNLPIGVYFIKTRDSEKSTTKRLLIVK